MFVLRSTFIFARSLNALYQSPETTLHLLSRLSDWHSASWLCDTLDVSMITPLMIAMQITTRYCSPPRLVACRTLGILYFPRPSFFPCPFSQSQLSARDQMQVLAHKRTKLHLYLPTSLYGDTNHPPQTPHRLTLPNPRPHPPKPPTIQYTLLLFFTFNSQIELFQQNRSWTWFQLVKF